MPSTQEMVGAIEELLGRAKTIDDRSRDRHQEGDLRIAMSGLPGNSLHTYLLIVAMSDSTIGRSEWWQRSYGSPHRPSDNDLRAIQELEKLTKHSMFVFFLSRIEWNFRKLVTYFDVNACSGGKAPFKNIYDWLFDRTGMSDVVPLYDLSRHVRNSIHTNGRFVPPSGRNVTITWGETEYNFQSMQAIDFVTHEFLFSTYSDLLDSIDRLLETDSIKSPDLIEDKIYT